MEQTDRDAIAEIIALDTWTMADSAKLLQLLAAETNAPEKFKTALARMEAADPEPKGTAAVKIGLARYMVCRFASALTALAAGTDNKDRRYAQAMCFKNLRQYDKAVEELQRAAERGWDGDNAEIQRIECLVLAGRRDEAGAALNKLARALGETPDTCYLQGLLAELSGDPEAACDFYEQARGFEGFHASATFRLAYTCDLHGDEDHAVDLYKECLDHSPVHASSLLNLAVLYEDAGDYERAGECLKKILACNPTHPRVRLFLRDVEASKTMYFDEDQARRIAKHNAVLDIPVTDFELSVRARNCLKKMNIRTLGDLVVTTEAELLAYKNFGETSLREIKGMLVAKGLHLGQGSEDRDQFQMLFGDDDDGDDDKSSADEELRDTPLNASSSAFGRGRPSTAWAFRRWATWPTRASRN